MSSASVRVGSTSIEDGGQEIDVVWAGLHPKFFTHSDVASYDVALMQLASEIVIDGVATRAVKLTPASSKTTTGQLLTVSGWGTLHVSSSSSSRLAAEAPGG